MVCNAHNHTFYTQRVPAENSPSGEAQIHACGQTVLGSSTQINSYVYRGIHRVISKTSADRDRMVIESSAGVLRPQAGNHHPWAPMIRDLRVRFLVGTRNGERLP